MRKHVGWLVALVMLLTVANPGLALSEPAPKQTESGLVAADTEQPSDPSPSQLVGFDTCDAFLDHLKSEALARVGPYGFARGRPLTFFGAEDAAEAAAEEDSGRAAGGSAGGSTKLTAGVDYSTTNVQEVGVDEPDIVKTDGTRILALAQGVLYYIDVSSGAPALVSTYDLWPWYNPLLRGLGSPDIELFLSGDTALLMMSGYRYEPLREPGVETVIVQIDLSQPVVLRVVRSLSIEGSLVSSRLVGERASLVLSSMPRIESEFVYPASMSESAMARAERANRAAIRESTLAHWLPGYELRVRNSRTAREGRLIKCSANYAPQEFSGFGLLSVLNLDLAENIGVGEVATVMAGGDTVYASADRLYVANRRWIDRNNFDAADAKGITTRIHRFAIGGSDGPVYEASGSVDGFLLNQFAMSEHNGYLRVASTDAPVWGWWRSEASESRVDVLERDGGELRAVGSVAGLGKGERIFAVRFIGEVGYVVTFRQTDPLYTIDLSDPSDPKVAGELKILGYSAYLHPIGEGLLLGVGRDADEVGRVKGTQVSIFDVSDLAKPVRTHQFTLPESSRTEVEFNHRAFLYWAPTGTAVLPVGWWGDRDESGRRGIYQGAIVLGVGPDGIEELGTIEHEPPKGAPEFDRGSYYWRYVPIRRSLVIGQTIFTLSDAGLAGTDLTSVSETSWTRFPYESSTYRY